MKDHFSSDISDIVYVTAHIIPETGTIQFKSHKSLVKAVKKYDRSKLFGRSLQVLIENSPQVVSKDTETFSRSNKNEKMRNEACSRDDRSNTTIKTKKVSFKGKINFKGRPTMEYKQS